MESKWENKNCFKILMKKGGDTSILTRSVTERTELCSSTPLPRPSNSPLGGGPKSRAVVCGYCYQPASSGPCRSYPDTGILICGEWIRDSRLDSKPVLQRDCKPRRCSHGRGRPCHSALESVGHVSTTASSPSGNSTGRAEVSDSVPMPIYTLPDSPGGQDDNVFFPDQTESTYWIGCEFIYSLKSETLKMSVKQSGELPTQYGCQQVLRATIILQSSEEVDVKQTVKLGKVGNPNKKTVKLRFQEHSCWRVQHMTIKVQLKIDMGLFRSNLLVDAWAFPLTTCHFLYPRTHWHHVQ